MLSASNIDKIMGHMGYPVTRYYSGVVTDACTQLALYGGSIAETRVIGYLTDMDADLAGIKAGAANANLIQADVLKWAEIQGGRVAGYYQDYARLKVQLANTLELTFYTQSNNNEAGTLTRG